ncbi:DMT family transporter [Pseudaeromonas sp. ZJS20]|uniref:DMT family transporter n=1 Tax=Pseudaeromonas aegiceratis TaxID=3153928 RepID=UPI00390CC57F
MRAADYCRLLLLAAIWGASFLFMRIAAPALGAINTAFLRVLFASLGLSLLVLLIRRRIDFADKLPVALLLGIINSGLPFLMYCLAAKWLPAGYSAILNATTPLMGVAIGSLFFGEQLTLKKSGGVVLGLLGVMLITTRGQMALSLVTLQGILACLLATACYGLAGFLTRRWVGQRGGLDPMQLALGTQIGASLFLLPFFAYSQITSPLPDWNLPAAWFSVVAVGLLCTAVAYILYFRLLHDIGPLRSLTVTFLIPPFGIFWGYLVLGESLNSGFVFGALVIGVATWLVLSPSTRSPR